MNLYKLAMVGPRIGSCVVLGMLLPGCATTRTAEVRAQLTVQPRITLPAQIQAVAVEKPNYLYRATESGLMSGEGAWYQDFLGTLKTRIQEAAPGLHVVDREDLVTGKTEGERIRRVHGSDPDLPKDNPNFMGADAYIVPRFEVETYQTTSLEEPGIFKRAIPSVLGQFGGQVGRDIAAPDRNLDRVYRLQVKVTCDMGLVDQKTGVDIAHYARSIERDLKTSEGILGIGATNYSQLESVNKMIGEMIVQHTDGFVAEFLPITRTLQVTLVGISESVAEAVHTLNFGNLAQAKQVAEGAWSASGEKDHAAAFIVGLVYEMEDNRAVAGDWYKRAVSLKGSNRDYRAALNRIYAGTGGQRLAGK